MADPSPLPGRAANNHGNQNSTSDLDGVDLIQQAWERERPGTPASSIGVITRIWRIGKLLADERRRTLARLGVDAAPGDTPERLRERLNERYLEEVRALKQRQQAGEIALSEYARHVQALKEELLGV